MLPMTRRSLSRVLLALLVCAIQAFALAPQKSKKIVATTGEDQTDAAQASLSPIEKEIIKEINLARTEPGEYASLLQAMKKSFRGNEMTLPSGKTRVTVEGVTALEEAIAFLRNALPQPPLFPSRGLSLGARDHVRDMGLTGNTGHRGSDGSITDDRLRRYGDWQKTIGENIVYDGTATARAIVIGMIIDDGTPTRGHRRNLFKPDFRVMGIALGDPCRYGTMCVITFAGGYAEGFGAAPNSDKGKPVPRRY